MKIAIIGATGEVGRMMIRTLEEENINVSDLFLFSSERSSGSKLHFRGKEIIVQKLTEESMTKQYDFLLFSAGGEVSGKFAPIAAKAGNIVIDNSSKFRQEPKIPLIVPEINGDLLHNYRGIIANPNCSTIQMVLALYPLDQMFGLKKVIISTYQSVSGAGNTGISTMMNQRNGSNDLGSFQKKIDLNVIPQIGDFLENGYSTEEEKMSFETQKILRNENIKVSATTVRVPVIHGHSEVVYAEFEKEINLLEAEALLSAAESVKLCTNDYITPVELQDSVYSHVCRLRYGTDQNTLTFWNVGHNVRLGAATNAVRILKKMIKSNLSNYE